MYVLQKLLTIFVAQWNIQRHFTKLQIPLKVTPITQQIKYVWVNLELARCTVFISVLFYVNMWRIYVFNRPQLQLVWDLIYQWRIQHFLWNEVLEPPLQWIPNSEIRRPWVEFLLHIQYRFKVSVFIQQVYRLIVWLVPRKGFVR